MNQFGCLLIAKVIKNVPNGMNPIRVAKFFSQTAPFRKGRLYAFVEEMGKIINTGKNVTENYIEKGSNELMNKML